MPGGARTQLTFSQERSGGASYRPKTGDYFVFNRDIGGNEFFQYYRHDFADGGNTLLTDGKSRNTGWNWSNAGDRAVYNSTRRNAAIPMSSSSTHKIQKTDRMLLQFEWRRGGALQIGHPMIASCCSTRMYLPTKLISGLWT